MAETSPGQSSQPVPAEGIPAAAILLPIGVAALGCLLLAVVLFMGGGTLGSTAARSPALVFLLVVLVPVGLLVFGLATLRRPQLPVSALLFACVFVNEAIERVSLPLAFFRLYPQDVLFGLALVAVVLRIRSGSGARWRAGMLGRLIVVAILMGMFEAFRGVVLGNEVNAAFGDFRRGYFYMIVFFLVLVEGSEPDGLRWVHRAFLVGALAIAGRGLYRLTIGNLYQMSWFDVFHVLSHSDLVFVIFLSYYCFGRVVYPTAGRRRWPWLLLLPLTLILIVLGNFRASWIGFALAGLLMVTLLPKAKRRLLVLAAIPILLTVAVGFYAARNVRIGAYGETVQGEAVSKLRGLVDWRTDTNIIWRLHSYGAALRIWSEHPILGAGLGKRLVFHSINAAGEQAIHFNHRAHNALLWVGFTTGAVGMIIFLALHLTYFFGALRRLKALGERPEAGVLLAYIGFYVAFMVTALFDIILEDSPTAIAMYAHMAIVWRLSRPAARET